MNDTNRLAPATASVQQGNPLLPMYQAQRAAFLRAGPTSYAHRIEALKRLRQAVVDHHEQILDAVDADFGHRSRHETFFADVIGLLGEIRHTRKHLKNGCARDAPAGARSSPSPGHASITSHAG